MFEKFLHQTPFFRFILPLIAGILFQINFQLIGDSLHYILYSFILVTILFIILKLPTSFLLNKVWGLLASLTLFVLGMQLIQFKQKSENYFNNTEHTFIATIIEQPEEKANSVKTILKINLLKDSLKWKENDSRILCYFQKDSSALNLKLGDQIITRTYLNDITFSGNPYTFNYKNYLKYKEIYNQCYIKTNRYKITAHNQGSKIRLLSNKIRLNLLNIYKNNNIKGDDLSVLAALTLGYKSELTPEIKESFSASGAMHILAVSGLHVGIIFIILCKLLFFLNKNKYGKILQSLIIIIVLFFYAFLTGLSDSVLRATIMFTFISIGKMFTRQVNIYNTISASAFILLIINPYSIMNVGFQLSYAAVISIVFFQPKIYSLLNFRRTIPDYIWQLITVAIAAQIGTFPITLHYFNQFPVYFILSNIIIIPLAIIIIYIAIVLFTISFSKILTFYVSIVLKYVTHTLNNCVNIIEQLPFSKIDHILVDHYQILILLVIIITVSFFMITKRINYFRYAILLLSGFIIYNIVSTYLRSKESVFTVHNVSGISAIDYIENNKVVFISNDTVNINDNNISYNVVPLWEHYRVGKKNITYVRTGKSLNFFKFKNKRILQICNDSISRFTPKKKLKVNYIILSNNINIHVNELKKYFEFDKIIFDSSNSYYAAKNWTKECNKNNINFYNINNKGAYIEYL